MDVAKTSVSTQSFHVDLLWEQVWRVTLAKGELKSGIPKLNSAFAGDTNFLIRVMDKTVAERLCRGKRKFVNFANTGKQPKSLLVYHS
jgi:hypothetical protein